MLVAADTQRGAIRLQPAAQILAAGAGTERMPLGRQADLPFLDDGDPVLRVVVAVARPDVRLFAGPRGADLAHGHARLRVVDFALWRLVVAGTVAGAAEVHREPAVADVNVAGAARRTAVAAEVHRDVARRALQLFGRNRVGDHVHEPTDRIGAVEQRRRTADHFDLACRRGVGRHRVIARLTRQVAHALSVLEHRHAIAVEPADDRPRRSGPELAQRHAGRFRQRCANRRLEVLGQLLSRQHRRRLIRLELRTGRRAHR